MLTNDYYGANKGKIQGKLASEHIFGFCKTFKKITENLGFHSTFKTANTQDIIFTSIDDNINVTINSLYLYVPFFNPSTETQLMFNESIKKNYRTSYDDWYTERRDTIYQVDIGSAQSVNSPKHLIEVHQTAARLNSPSKILNISRFDNLSVKKDFVEKDGYRYPHDSVLINYELNDYRDQYGDLILFFREYVGEKLLNSFIS